MTIGDFLRKNVNSYKTQISALEYKIKNYNVEKNKINKELMNNSHNNTLFTRIVEILGIIWMGVMITGVGLGFFGFLPLEAFVIAMFTALSGGFISYKAIDSIISKKTNEKSRVLQSDKKFFLNELELCKRNIQEYENIVEQIKKTMSFFEYCNRNDYLSSDMPIREIQMIEYLKHDFSLISILNLANNNELPNKVFKDLKEDELEILKSKANVVDIELDKNPLFFFENNNLVTSNNQTQRTRNYRSTRYREINDYETKIENGNNDDKGHSR